MKKNTAKLVAIGGELHKVFGNVGYAGDYLWIVSYQGADLAEIVARLQGEYQLPLRILAEDRDKLFYAGRQGDTELLAQELGGKSYLGKGDIWICELVRDPEKPLLETVHDIEITLL